MLQFTYLQNGDIKIMSDTSDQLLEEIFKQFKQGLIVCPRTYSPRSVYNPITTVTMSLNAPKLINAAFDVYEVSPITRRVISRDAESFFTALKQESDKGFEFEYGSAKMTFGAFSASVKKRGNQVEENPVSDGIPLFDISVALAFTDKEALIAYCDTFGIDVDKRKSLPKIQNWLKAKNSEGK